MSKKGSVSPSQVSLIYIESDSKESNPLDRIPESEEPKPEEPKPEEPKPEEPKSEAPKSNLPKEPSFSGSLNRKTGVVKSFILTLPNDAKLPRSLLKEGGSIKRIGEVATKEDVAKTIEEMEDDVSNIINNVQQITVNCSSCCLKFNRCLTAKDVNVKNEKKTRNGIFAKK